MVQDKNVSENENETEEHESMVEVVVRWKKQKSYESGEMMNDDCDYEDDDDDDDSVVTVEVLVVSH